RAPAHPQACLVTEQVMDDLADKLGIDPLDFRIKNIPEVGAFKTLKPIYEKEIALGAEKIGWQKNRHSRGDKSQGPIKRGLGCGLSTWGGGAGQAQATCTIHPDGSVEVAIGSQDLGTGTTTLVPLVAAEILGLQVKDVTGKLGSSIYPPAGGSGGSTSCGGVSVAVGVASMKALALVFEKVAPKVDQGKIVSVMSSQGVGGAHFADVSVDIETGEVRVNKIVAVADCGMVMNRILCESQVLGGVIGALNSALFEERRLDPKTGVMLNPDLEWYKLAGHTDIPDIEVHLLDYPERGVIGIGEPPYIPGAAAIANAVTNAVGVRVGGLPFTPRRILSALK